MNKYSEKQLKAMNNDELKVFVETMQLEDKIVATGKPTGDSEEKTIVKADMVLAIVEEQERLQAVADAKVPEKTIKTGNFGHPLQLARIINLDTREKDIPQDYVGYGNDIEENRKIIVYGEELEIEKPLIDYLRTVQITVHVAEKDNNGKATGNRRPKRVNKYAVEVIEKELFIEDEITE